MCTRSVHIHCSEWQRVHRRSRENQSFCCKLTHEVQHLLWPGSGKKHCLSREVRVQVSVVRARSGALKRNAVPHCSAWQLTEFTPYPRRPASRSISTHLYKTIALIEDEQTQPIEESPELYGEFKVLEQPSWRSNGHCWSTPQICGLVC